MKFGRRAGGRLGCRSCLVIVAVVILSFCVVVLAFNRVANEARRYMEKGWVAEPTACRLVALSRRTYTSKDSPEGVEVTEWGGVFARGRSILEGDSKFHGREQIGLISGRRGLLTVRWGNVASYIVVPEGRDSKGDEIWRVILTCGQTQKVVGYVRVPSQCSRQEGLMTDVGRDLLFDEAWESAMAEAKQLQFTETQNRWEQNRNELTAFWDRFR